ncbi:hypothetical protein ACL02T_19605 [Pseudonocardia sp. RS010]|uniref:hypothetical protein n=1 Tax=Pseudonocardia sp. RS010 TaxID=3385979 RepID=UPI0039A08DF2
MQLGQRDGGGHVDHPDDLRFDVPHGDPQLGGLHGRHGTDASRPGPLGAGGDVAVADLGGAGGRRGEDVGNTDEQRQPLPATPR